MIFYLRDGQVPRFILNFGIFLKLFGPFQFFFKIILE